MLSCHRRKEGKEEEKNAWRSFREGEKDNRTELMEGVVPTPTCTPLSPRQAALLKPLRDLFTFCENLDAMQMAAAVLPVVY